MYPKYACTTCYRVWILMLLSDTSIYSVGFRSSGRMKCKTIPQMFLESWPTCKNPLIREWKLNLCLKCAKQMYFSSWNMVNLQPRFVYQPFLSHPSEIRLAKSGFQKSLEKKQATFLLTLKLTASKHLKIDETWHLFRRYVSFREGNQPEKPLKINMEPKVMRICKTDDFSLKQTGDVQVKPTWIFGTNPTSTS